MIDPPPSYDRDPIEFTEEEREAFKWRLEAVMNGVLRIRRMAEREDPTEVIRRNRLELAAQAADLIADVCGDWVKVSENDADGPLDYAALALTIWQPAIAMHDEHDDFWDRLISEIRRLPFGDEPELLRPAPRPRGAHARPAQLAFRRLAALSWAAYLKSRGIKPSVYHFQISAAFGTDWDAIRKWRGLIGNVLGQSMVDRQIAYAADGIGYPNKDETYHWWLVRDGAHFRELVGLPKISESLMQELREGKDRT